MLSPASIGVYRPFLLLSTVQRQANVLLELGLAYGVGKPVIIIKDTITPAISALGSIEYIEYLHAHDIMQKLTKALEKNG